MAWSAPTTAIVLAEFTGKEADMISAQQGTDNLSGILSRAVAEIRDAIMAGGYAVDTDATKLPAGLHTVAIDITRWRMLVAIPALKLMQTEERKSAFDAAQAKLKAIANQEWAVEPPTPVTGSVGRMGSWNSENKLIPRTHPAPRPTTQMPADADHYGNPDAPSDQAPE